MENALAFILFLLVVSAIVFLVLLIVYFRRTNSLSRKVDELQNSVLSLKAKLENLTGREKGEVKDAEKEAAAPVVESAGLKEALEIKQVSAQSAALLEAKVEVAVKPTEKSAPISREIEKKKSQLPHVKSRTREEWESLIAGRWLNRIGALAIIIALGFFFKYAYDRHWISEILRVLIGCLVGAALIFGGFRFHKRDLKIFAQGLIGAGICCFYLSFFAAFSLYHLISQPVALLFMLGVTIMSFALALRYNALAISLLGWCGGFLTPIMLSTGHANEVGLFSYLIILAGGIQAVALKREKWLVLEPLTFLSTYLMVVAWYQKFYQPADLMKTIIFLALFWLIFYIADVIRMFRIHHHYSFLHQAIAVLNAFACFGLLYRIINPAHHHWMGLTTLLIGLPYLLTVLIAKHRQKQDPEVMPRFILTFIALMVIATTIQMKGMNCALFWALEALVLVWCGVRWHLAYVWKSGLALYAMAVVKLFASHGVWAYRPIQDFVPVLNKRFLSLVVIAAAVGLGARLSKSLKLDWQRVIRSIMNYAWPVLLFVLITLETNDSFRRLLLNASGDSAVRLEYLRWLFLALAWMAYSLIFVFAGLKSRLQPLLVSGVVSMFFALLMGGVNGASFEPLSRFHLLLNWRAAVLLLLLAGTSLHWAFMRRRKAPFAWVDNIVKALHYIRCLVLFLLLTFETSDYFRMLFLHGSGQAWREFHFIRSLILPAIWLIMALLLYGYGRMKAAFAYLYCGLAVLGVAFAGVVIGGISFLPIEDFKFLFNLRAAVVLLVIAVVYFYLHSLRKKPLPISQNQGIVVACQHLFSILILFLVTVEANDFFNLKLINAQGLVWHSLIYKKLLVMPCLWALYVLPFGFQGLRKKNQVYLFYSGLALVSATIVAVFYGFSYAPLEFFSLILNVRFLVFLMVVAAFSFYYYWLKKFSAQWNEAELLRHFIQIILVFLVFELLSMETWNYFSKQMLLASQVYTAAGDDVGWRSMLNLRQLFLSSVWLVYSIILVILGIWRRIFRIRLMAIILFGITILKIFLYDLSFLQTFYRIFSFLALGVILLAVSYLYQRFKAIIFETPKAK